MRNEEENYALFTDFTDPSLRLLYSSLIPSPHLTLFSWIHLGGRGASEGLSELVHIHQRHIGSDLRRGVLVLLDLVEQMMGSFTSTVCLKVRKILTRF